MDKKVAKRFGMFALATALLAGLSGCASTANNPKDPLEGFNRAMFSFNDGLDKAIIKPVAQGYDYVLPQPVQTGVGNFFGNIADVFIAVNNLLQGKPADAASDAGRFLLNTTIGRRSGKARRGLRSDLRPLGCGRRRLRGVAVHRLPHRARYRRLRGGCGC